jgi:hypothetical protein
VPCASPATSTSPEQLIDAVDSCSGGEHLDGYAARLSVPNTRSAAVTIQRLLTSLSRLLEPGAVLQATARIAWLGTARRGVRAGRPVAAAGHRRGDPQTNVTGDDVIMTAKIARATSMSSQLDLTKVLGCRDLRRA